MPADTDALNYPYIGIRSADWLKRTLLIFPHVARMTPFSDAPADDPDIEEFRRQVGRRGPLLRSANLWPPHVESAQTELIRELDLLLHASGDDLLKRFQRRRPPKRDSGQTLGH